jgi:3-oxoacyl-[acyl-carrier protein] reductase
LVKWSDQFALCYAEKEDVVNQLDLNNRTAVVTGGAAGIGFAIAQRLAASGARVSLWDRDEAMLAKARQALGERTHTVRLDVTQENQVADALASTLQAMGQVDALVCSAGITGPNTTTWEYPTDAWKQVLDINLTGVFLCNKAVVPHMQKRDYGRIVNIASIAGKEGNPNASAYSASKAGVISLTKSLGKELAKTGIRVNCVTPAAVKTGMFEQMTQQHIDFMLSKIPMARFGLVEEIAAMVAWLCTEDCSFSTGAVFDLSGGRAVY